MSKLNPLGDLRAENDGRMLESAFYETPDFKSLLESSDKSLIVGRRGTGKSTIYLRFADRFNQMHNTSLITLAPEDYEVQALRGFFKKYNKEYNIIKSFSKVLFQYALILEVSSKFIEYYKIREDKEFEILIKATSEFKKSGSDFFSRLINLFAQLFSKYQKDDVWLSKFVSDSDFKNLTEIFIKALAKNRNRVVLLIDRLDEGYIGDTNGIGLIAGIIEAINGLNIRSENFITYVFLRDNISRSIARLDPDYTRNFG